MIHNFPKNENTQTISFQRSCSHVSFSGQGLYCVNFHRPTSQEFTPTSNITLLILCSRQAIVSLCRPGGVRTARFNPPPLALPGFSACQTKFQSPKIHSSNLIMLLAPPSSSPRRPRTFRRADPKSPKTLLSG